MQHALLEPAQSSTEFRADVLEFDLAIVVPPDVPSSFFNATLQQTTMQCNTAEEGETNTITTLHQMGGGSTNQVPLLAFLNSDLNAIRTISRACRENAEDYVLKLRRWENTGNWNEDDD